MNKKFLIIAASALGILVLGIMAFGFSDNNYNQDKKWVKEYVVGAEGILGSVDVSDLGDNSAYDIGANKDGYAVFKNPEKAFKQMQKDYALGLEAIQSEYNLFSISDDNFKEYGTYGWQLTETTDEEAIRQAIQITKFLDIYENSF